MARHYFFFGPRPPLKEAYNSLQKHAYTSAFALGVADYLGTDVTATRVGLAAVAVLAHVAIPVYVAGWALIPEEGKSRSRAAEFLDSVTTRVRQV